MITRMSSKNSLLGGLTTPPIRNSEEADAVGANTAVGVLIVEFDAIKAELEALTV